MNPDAAVQTIMTTQLVTVRPEHPVSEVQALFREHSFHHLPVVEKGNRLLGIISKEDVFKLAYVLSLDKAGTHTQKDYRSLKAEDIMTRYPVTLDPDDSIGLAADIFLANKFHALPIVEDEELVGLVTTHDLLAYRFAEPVEAKTEEAYEE